MRLLTETSKTFSLLTGAALIAALSGGCGDDSSADTDTGNDGTTTTDTPATTDTPDTDDATPQTTGETEADTEAEDETTAGETGEPACEVEPGEWDAPDWDANAADALAVRAALDTLTGGTTMRGAETGDVDIASIDELTALWDGDPSLADAANPGFLPVVQDSFEEFMTILAAGEQDLTDEMGVWTPGPDGGIWAEDFRGINEGGMEVRQIVDKGGYSAGLMYHYAATQTEGDITPATMDAIAAAWGNNADLDPEGDLTDAAGYALGMGFHADMASALTRAKAFAGDEACGAERDAAVVQFFNLWEQSMYARMVFYGNRAEGRLLKATEDANFAAVLHDLSEGVGLIAGFTGLPDYEGPLAGTRISTQADVDAVMDVFGVDLGDLGASTSGPFVESLPDFEAAVTGSEEIVIDVFGVTPEEIAEYAMPTPG
ncbi:MAG: hypothetical protein AAF799_22965 [Myxococcota bacterium]